MKTQNLINGQRPQFGNPEHIAWLKQKQHEAANGIVIPEVKEYEITTYCLEVSFECPTCGAKVEDDFESEDHDIFDGETTTCPECEEEYRYENGKFYRQ